MSSSTIDQSSNVAILATQPMLPVVVGTLQSSTGFDFDIFLRPPGKQTPVLYRKQHIPLLESDLNELHNSGIQTLHIPVSGLEAYQDHLRNLLSAKAISPKTCFCALRDVNQSLFLSTMKHGSVEKVVALARRLGQDYADLVAAHDHTAQDFFSVLNHDPCPFAHVTNVCIYSVMLAKHLSICQAADLAAIATGALLHDIGKRKVSMAIFTEQARLSEHETRLMKRHPQAGFMDLAPHPDLNWSQLMMVFQHHERIDGRGYPVQIAGEEIDPWARLCSIADVFDALTNSRSGRESESGSDVLLYFTENADKVFDREMVECWIKSVRPMN